MANRAVYAAKGARAMSEKYVRLFAPKTRLTPPSLFGGVNLAAYCLENILFERLASSTLWNK